MPHKFTFINVQKTALLQHRNKIHIKFKVTYFLNAIFMLWELLQWKLFCYAFAKMHNSCKSCNFCLVKEYLWKTTITSISWKMVYNKLSFLLINTSVTLLAFQQYKFQLRENFMEKDSALFHFWLYSYK